MAEAATITVAGRRWRLAPGADPDYAETLIRRAMLAVDRGEASNVKSGRRKRLYLLTLLGGGSPDHILKVKAFQYFPGILRMVRRSSARREFDLAFTLNQRGLPAALPLAEGEERRRGRLLACYLISPIMKDVTDLRRLLAQPDLPPAARRTIAAAFGAFSRRVHDAGLYQDDYAPNNFLVRRGDPPSFLLIDFEHAHLARRLRRSSRLWMLAKLDRHLARFRTAERMRFLMGYSGGDPKEARLLWRALDRLAPRLARRDLRRMRVVTASEGRRFRHVRDNGQLAWAPRDLEIPWDVLEEQGRGPRSTAPRAAGERWILDYGPLSARAAKRTWALANALWAWGALGPRPIFLVQSAGAVRLGLAREPGARLLSEMEDPGATLSALTVLCDQLISVGEIDPALGPDAFAIAPGPEGVLRATLLAPHHFRFRRSAIPDHHARARALARTLINGIARPAFAGARPIPGIPAPAAGDRSA